MSEFCIALHAKQPDTILLTGGGPEGSVNKVAEHAWLALGGKLWSYRPKQLGTSVFGIEVWKLGYKHPRILPILEPTYKDFASAAKARSWMMLETALRVCSFHNGWSPGTALEIDLTLDFIKNPNLPTAHLYHH